MLSTSNLFLIWWLSIKRNVLLAVGGLTIFGLFVVFSVGYSASEKLGAGSLLFFGKQLVAVVVGVFLMLLASVIDFKNIKKYCEYGFYFCVFLLVVVLFIGNETKGAKRWIGIGFGTIQPSEILKPFYTLFIAKIFVEWNETKDSKYLLQAITTHVLVCILFFLEPDFGMVLTYSIIFGSCFFLSNIPMTKFFSVLGITIMILASVAFSLDHVRFRVVSFFFGGNADNYQTGLALSAVKSGGFFGIGFSESKLKYILPDAHNDFIFAIICEEFGSLMAIVLLGVYLFLIYEILIYSLDLNEKLENVARVEMYQNYKHNKSLYLYKRELLFCQIFLISSVCLIFFEVFVNSCTSLSLIPTKGMTLPFVSYGGSSMVSHLIIIGLILNFSKKRFHFLPIIS